MFLTRADRFESPALEILEEWLRQVRQSYNVALNVIGTSAILAFVGVGLVYGNKVREGAK